LGFEKNANFFAENKQKSPKIVTITSTPGGIETIAIFPPKQLKCLKTVAKSRGGIKERVFF
jgi:hypothetical protein